MISCNSDFRAIVEKHIGGSIYDLKKINIDYLGSFDRVAITQPFNSNGVLDFSKEEYTVYEDPKTKIKILRGYQKGAYNASSFYILEKDYETFVRAHSINKYCVNIPKKYINYIENFLNNEDYKKYGIFLNKGLILSGPPGNGKSKILDYIFRTYASRYVMNEELFNARYIPRSIDAEEAGYRKKIEYNIELLDDVDMRVFEESSPQYNSILPQFDNGSILVARIFATNQKIDCISRAFLRPGRISDVLEITHPDREEREALFKDFPVNLVEETEGLSYAEIQYVKVCLIENDFDVDKGLKRSEERLSLKINKNKKAVGF